MKRNNSYRFKTANRSGGWLKLTFIVVAIASVSVGCSSAKDSAGAGSLSKAPFDPTYSVYAQLLSQYVKGDRVDYEGLSDKKDALEKVVAGFSALQPDSLKTMSQSGQVAFYINAYNAITLYSILERYPDIKSIKDIPGVWDKRKWNVAGEPLTLNDIENQKLRGDFHEPRIHFAINCASIGCPPLSPVPFLAATLEKQLAEQASAFFNNPQRFQYDGETGKLYVTRIFKWFGDDFLANNNPRPKNGSLSKREAAIVAFIAARLPAELSRKVLDGAKSIEYMEYDWSLNDIDRQN